MMVNSDYNDNEYDPIASCVMIIFIIKRIIQEIFHEKISRGFPSPKLSTPKKIVPNVCKSPYETMVSEGWKRWAGDGMEEIYSTFFVVLLFVVGLFFV